MRRSNLLLLSLLLGAGLSARAQMPTVHDPSTVIADDGRYYVFTTGKGAPILSSPDSYTWTRVGSVFDRIPEDVRAASPGNNGTDVWAPDVIHVDGQFLLYYAVSSWNSYVSAVGLATNTTLDPASPAYKWVDRGIVVQSRAGEDLNAIDPGVVHAPDGSLWLSYGSYHGTIQLIELDRKTGLRLYPEQKAAVIASRSESSDIIAHDGYFYLFVNHGTCCQGRKSGYNIRVGRARAVTGPYLDKQGRRLADGGGSLFLAGTEGRIGPGHFGRVQEPGAVPGDVAADETAPAERFSIHYEASDENNGRPTLDIRPLLWSVDGWPIAGDNVHAGRYVLRSAATEDVLDLLPHSHANAGPADAPPSASATDAATATLILADSTARTSQQWTVEPAGAGYFKVTNVLRGDALQAGATPAAPTGVAPFSNEDSQLWRFEQLPDGTYHVRNKATHQLLQSPAQADIREFPDASQARSSTQWILAAP